MNKFFPFFSGWTGNLFQSGRNLKYVFRYTPGYWDLCEDTDDLRMTQCVLTDGHGILTYDQGTVPDDPGYAGSLRFSPF
jgi:hypothetical protein